jgi:AcrR family transcriptional regulator
MKPEDRKLGLRERKKAATRLAISDVATRLFIQRGFDQVTIAQVADAADVSVNTIFNYFTTKEELFFDRAEEVIDLPSRLVRERKVGESAAHALRRCCREALDGQGFLFPRGDDVRRFFETIEASPALKARERLYGIESEHRLARTLAEETGRAPDDPTARTVAAMTIGLISMLVREHRVRILRREPDDTTRAALRKLSERGFKILIAGDGDYAVRAR